MSKHRVVKSDFWVDDYFEEVTIKEKFFFLYLLTNPETNILGIYKTTVKRMSFETGLTKIEINSFLETWSDLDKVYFKSSYILLVNHHKHNIPSGTMKRGIEKLILNLPFDITSFILSEKSNIYNRLSIGYLDSIHRANKDKDNNINKSKGKNNLPEIPKPTKKGTYSEEFENWWKIFKGNPTHGKGDKSKTFTEFKKIKPDQLPDLMKGTENYSNSTDGSYKAMNFLKQEIWKLHIIPQIAQNNNQEPDPTAWYDDEPDQEFIGIGQ